MGDTRRINTRFTFEELFQVFQSIRKQISKKLTILCITKGHLSKIITIWVSGVVSNCQNTIIVTVEFAYDSRNMRSEILNVIGGQRIADRTHPTVMNRVEIALPSGESSSDIAAGNSGREGICLNNGFPNLGTISC